MNCIALPAYIILQLQESVSAAEKTATIQFFYEHDIVITLKLSADQIKSIAPFTDKTPLQIYKAIEQQTSCCEKVDFHNMIKIERNLYKHGIPFQVYPELPIMTKLDECRPNLSDDYKWVLEIQQ